LREDVAVQLDVLTLFPQWFDWFREQRHVANALAAGNELRALDLREHTPLTGGQVDDTPFGGGAGMVLRVDVMDAALRGVYGADPLDLRRERRVIALTPGGRILDEAFVSELAAEPAVTLLCGRYEGFDERIVQHFCSDALSIGRYVIAGGELAAMVVCDAVLRKKPGALGHADSAAEESFSSALGGDPEYPHYTRPAEYRGWKVPDVLLSGHHEEIRRWRRARSRERGAASSGSPLS
jgi:tRNA (guanine37-N1)-methyltransferase